MLDRARRDDVPTNGHRIAVYRWGEGPRVLLHHGWSANAAQMTSFVDPLVEAGFEVIAVDALGHGASEGRLSSFVGMAADAVDLAERSGGVDTVIGHSMGALVATRVLRARVGRRAVLITPPAEMRVYSELFAQALGFPPNVHDAMVARFERTHDIGWDDITAEALSAGRTEPCLVVHDSDDRDAPPAHARRWIEAWPGPVDVLGTAGLGHRNVLRDDGVIETCRAWLLAPTDVRRGRAADL